jgi:transcriptional regulator of aromatic amino acid metabolism
MNGKITRNNIINEIKRAEALSKWNKKEDDDKLDEFINRFDEDVLEWHLEEYGSKRKASVSYEN